MRRWTRLRDRPVASVTKRSTRTGTLPSGTRSDLVSAPPTASGCGATIGPDREEDEEEDRRADRRVGDVERVPAPPVDARVDEVDDIAEPQPIEEVADRPAEQ